MNACAWTDRVSALIDGELPEEQRDLVAAHRAGCASCSALSRVDDFVSPASRTPAADGAVGRIDHVMTRRSSRVVLAVLGLALVAGSVSDLVRGSTLGDALHEARHLAMWQAAFGVAAVVSSRSFRFSRFVTAMTVTFCTLTLAATVYDAATGHNGPWTDPIHLIEIAIVAVCWRLAPAHLRPSLRGMREALGRFTRTGAKSQHI